MCMTQRKHQQSLSLLQHKSQVIRGSHNVPQFQIVQITNGTVMSCFSWHIWHKKIGYRRRGFKVLIIVISHNTLFFDCLLLSFSGHYAYNLIFLGISLNKYTDELIRWLPLYDRNSLTARSHRSSISVCKDTRSCCFLLSSLGICMVK